MEQVRLKIPNIDRVGLVMDISRVLAERQINIVSMEVELNTVFLEIAVHPASKQDLCHNLCSIPEVLGVEEIALMPHQEKSEQLKAVLGSISDGILAIDRDRRVTQYNPAAERIMRIPAAQLMGKSISDRLPADLPILTALRNGTVYNNREIVLENPRSHYLASGRPIKDPEGRIIGAVAVLKDISDVRELVYTMTGQLTFTFDEIVYSSSAMQRVVSLAKTIATGDSTVLIRGETGTGKELFARALHAASARAKKVFVPVNCAAIPDALLESELFGYEEGAFTGAVKGGKQGLFEYANGGTLFLDEISELSAHLQAKLLRILQDSKVRRIGSNREVSVNVRIIAATNRPLESMIENGRFREDLYYRLNVIPLFLPPLRERAADIPLLTHYFLRRFSAKMSKKVETVSETALAKLASYPWPGNVRELENVIERAVNIVTGTIVLAEHILLDQQPFLNQPIFSAAVQSLDNILDEVERDVLLRALQQHKTSRQLGKALGISHTAVLKKLKKHGLTTKDSEH